MVIAANTISQRMQEEHSTSYGQIAFILISSGWKRLRPSIPQSRVIEYLSSDSPTAHPALADSIISFYLDICDENHRILVGSYEGDQNRHVFHSYRLSDASDLSTFSKRLGEEELFVYNSSFFPPRGGWEKLNPRSASIATVRRLDLITAICVDLDPVEEMSCVNRTQFASILRRLPEELSPNAVCVTGRGVHFWYIFEEPLQALGPKNPRRSRFSRLQAALYSLFEALAASAGLKADLSCRAFPHAFRAPGSLTKFGDASVCFLNANPDHRRTDLLRLTSYLVENGFLSPAAAPGIEDLIHKTPEEIAREAEERRSSPTPASDSQLKAIENLIRSGAVQSELVPDGLSAREAGAIIGTAVSRMESSTKNRVPNYGDWTTKPHRFVAGSTGGIYATILSRMQDVEVGRRYESLFMLAGVAYMMVSPVKSLDDVRNDFMQLLSTPWARKAQPLTERDVNNALKGYRVDNWCTKKRVIDTMGFNPFAAPTRRNGNSREVHLSEVVPAIRRAKAKSKAMDALFDVFDREPGANKTRAAVLSGLSYPTVLKYWDEARVAWEKEHS